MNENTYRDVLQEGFELHWYEVKSVLGRGAFGVTYLVQDKNLNQLVAIKEYFPREFSSRDTGFTVHPSTGESSELFAWGLDRFVREAQTLAKFKHHNIVRVMSVFELNNTAYMVMEYEEGEDLSQRYKDVDRLSEQVLLTIFLPILDGLKLVHDEGFIHRDIKPANIYIRTDGSPVLIDFGAARKTAGAATRSITSLVTHGYAPFEQYNESNEKQGAWTDIYALGACLYCAINGKLPVDALARGSSLLSSGHDAYVPLSRIKKGQYSDNFLLAIDNALLFQAPQRPQDVLLWADMLKGQAIPPALPESIQYLPVVEDDDATIIVANSPSISPSLVPGIAPDIASTIEPDMAEGVVKNQIPDALSKRLSQRLNKTIETNDNNAQSKLINAIQWVANHIKIFAITLVILSISGVLLSLLLNDDVSNTSTIINQENKIDQNKLTSWLKTADKERKSGNLIETKNSAIHYYKKVLDMDANNSEATGRIQDIVELYTDGIRSDMDAGYYEKAKNNIKLLQMVLVNNKDLKKLAKEIKLVEKKGNKISILLNQAEKKYNAGKITRPDDLNAVVLYRKVLLLDADNREAKDALVLIFDDYINKAKHNLSIAKIDNAKRNVDDALYVDKKSSDAKFLKNKIFSNYKIIEKNILQAERQYKRGKISSPRNNNALNLYQRILKMDADNIKAIQGVKKIKKYFKSNFNKYIKAKKFKAAESLVVTVEKSMPKSRFAKNMRNNLIKSKKKSKPAFEMVNKMIGEFKKKFESRDINALQKISKFKGGRKDFLKQFYKNYKSFKMNISDIKYIGRESRGSAKIKLSQLINSRGSKVKGGTWSQFVIEIRMNNSGDWKVIW